MNLNFQCSVNPGSCYHRHWIWNLFHFCLENKWIVNEVSLSSLHIYVSLQKYFLQWVITEGIWRDCFLLPHENLSRYLLDLIMKIRTIYMLWFMEGNFLNEMHCLCKFFCTFPYCSSTVWLLDFNSTFLCF